MQSPLIEQNAPGSERAHLSASVTICAYTMLRWKDLCEAVESVTGQLRPGDECLIVIDHNEELLARTDAAFTGRHDVRVLANTGSRGLSGARNTAVAHSRRDILAFLDDDAVAGPGWLARMRRALEDPDVIGVGTAVLPRWPNGQRPPWFPSEFDWVVGCSYVGLPTVSAEVRNTIGAGMAFRREAFELAGGFSTMVGRVGTIPTGCEETELCIRVRRARPSARILYLPDVAVMHRVTLDRLRPSYFLRRCVGEGLSKARVAKLVGAGDGLSSERSYVSAVLPRGLHRELRRALRGEPAGWAACMFIIAGVVLAGVGYAGGRLSRRGRHGGFRTDAVAGAEDRGRCPRAT